MSCDAQGRGAKESEKEEKGGRVGVVKGGCEEEGGAAALVEAKGAWEREREGFRGRGEEVVPEGVGMWMLCWQGLSMTIECGAAPLCCAFFFGFFS